MKIEKLINMIIGNSKLNHSGGWMNEKVD